MRNALEVSQLISVEVLIEHREVGFTPAGTLRQEEEEGGGGYLLI